MKPIAFRQTRQLLHLTQDQLAEKLRTTRRSIIRYEDGSRRIPGMAEVALQHLATTHISMAGIVAAGEPIEPIPQTERVEVPKSMLGRGDTFALRVKGSSMRDEGIFSGDVVVVQKQSTARNGQTVIALVNGEATVKTYCRKSGRVELHPANDTLKPIVVKETDAFHIEGIVVGVMRHLGRWVLHPNCLSLQHGPSDCLLGHPLVGNSPGWPERSVAPYSTAGWSPDQHLSCTAP